MGNAKRITWLQEEPRNGGAWTFIREKFCEYFPNIDLEYFGRDESSSNATGSFKQFQQEQKKLIEDVFDLPVT